MIPVKLRLRNFMPYRDSVPVLDLEGLHIACLCGENGAGKSSLLEAMTWCLWGEARAKSVDDLIHIGQDEMEVELEFLVSGTLYRALRKRQRGAGRRAGTTLLELHVSSGDGFEPITAGTVRETQRKINGILRMDYDTFINSAFLVQGRADEFTLKSPGKRKEVLAEILNLSYYDSLEECAREEGRRLRAEHGALDLALQDIDRELERRDEFRQAHEAAKAALAGKETERGAAEADVRALRSEQEALAFKDQQRKTHEERMSELEPELAALHRQAQEAGAEIAEHEAVLSEAEAIRDGYRRLQEALERRADLDIKERAYHAMDQRKADLQAVLERARSGLVADRRVREDQVRRLHERAEGLEQTQTALEAAEVALRDLDSLLKESDHLQMEAEEANTKATEFEAANSRLYEEMQDLRGRLERLQAGDGVCPLCGTELGQDRCQEVLRSYQGQGERRKEEYQENKKHLDEATVKAEEARRRGSETKTTVRQTQPALQAKTGSLRHALEEASTAGGELPSAEAALAEVERLLAEQAFALEERRQLQDVTSQQQALGYDQAGHDAGKEEAQALRPFEERLRRLEEADRRLPQAKDRAAQYLASIERRERQAAQARQALQDLAKDLTGLPQITRDLEDKERRAKDLAEEEASLRLELGAAERDLARLDERARQRQVKRDRMEKVADEQAIYDELTVAFGKKGLQALIIESALPEIEEEATHLLARMTDNRMHLRLESQTAYRSREGLQETLEINISDELGERSYETFSGGEAFRINLALRIALSRTLARRAGAPLPTLFIDEGFGTQDPIGREKIVEAINAIADDFERIIIITHIDELKEQFPARIEVRKTPEGSTFWMS